LSQQKIFTLLYIFCINDKQRIYLFFQKKAGTPDQPPPLVFIYALLAVFLTCPFLVERFRERLFAERFRERLLTERFRERLLTARFRERLFAERLRERLFAERLRERLLAERFRFMGGHGGHSGGGGGGGGGEDFTDLLDSIIYYIQP